VFVLQPGSQAIEDDRVVFDCGKANNETPLPMSAWHRRNGEFLPCRDFDFDAWLSPGPGAGQRSVTEEMLRELFQDGHRALVRRAAVEELKGMGFSAATA
jgi:hypothetical protein